jgi:phytoene synthase
MRPEAASNLPVLLAPGPAHAFAQCQTELARHSKSFALAGRLLPGAQRRWAAAVYAWCRHADDAIDLASDPARPGPVLERLRGELDAVYGALRPPQQALGDLRLLAFAEVVTQRAIPALYPRELLEGLAMDCAGTYYRDRETLALYCYRVAGTVGLMMSHVLGIDDDAALAQAALLGMAMQLTNICRDVAEDWERNRLYLPDELLAAHGAAGLAGELGRPLPASAGAAIRGAVRDLLAWADALYRAGGGGLVHLPWRSAVAIAAAARIYRAIGQELARRDHDPLCGRAVVSGRRKRWLAARGALTAIRPARWRRRGPHLVPRHVLAYRDLEVPHAARP